MFKKRVPKAKNIDLHQETDLIVTLPIPEPEASPSENNNPSEQVKERSASRTPIYKRKPNNNVITLEALEVEESKRAFPSQPVDHIEIEECFTQICKWKEPEQEIIEPVPIQHHSLVMKSDDVSVDGCQNEDILQIEIDQQGGFSPVHENDEFMHEEDYEDVLIRKTLTRQNYERVNNHGGINLHQLKQSKVKDDLLEKIKKVSVKAIKNTISRDLHEKQNKLKLLQQDLEYIATRNSEKEGQIKRKQNRLNAMESELQRVNKVIEYLYFYGDRVQTFTVDSILRQSQQQSRPSMEFQQQQQC